MLQLAIAMLYCNEISSLILGSSCDVCMSAVYHLLERDSRKIESAVYHLLERDSRK